MSSETKAVSKTATATLELRSQARPKISTLDVQVPEGYVVEPVVTGLTFANSVAFSPEGTMFLCEGGVARPMRPFMGARVLAIEPSGRISEVVRENEGPLMGIAWHEGHLYAALDGSPSRIVRYDVGTGKRQTLVDGLPGGGTHPVNGPVFGPDGMMYFGQGTAAINGIVDYTSMAMGGAILNQQVHDVPGQDVTLTGVNYQMGNPLAPFPAPAFTGAFRPFGTKTKKGEKVEGKTLCTSSLLRANPDGSGLELLAWGIREGYGMAFDERGELFVGDNNMDEQGVRPIANDQERIWHIKNARKPAGTVSTPDWYGWPDYCGDGLSVTHPKHMPQFGPAPQPLLEDPPRQAGPAIALLEPHSGIAKMDFSRSDSFGHRGELFVCAVGSFAPKSTPREEQGVHGFAVLRVDTRTGEVVPFMHNKHPGPASAKGPHGGTWSAGIERPVDCKFGPDGALYVVDIGRLDTTTSGMVTYGRTGVVWRVRPSTGVGA